MADSILNIILRASKTGSGASDASRELKELDQQIKIAHQSAVQSTRGYYDMAQSLKGNSSIASVTQTSLKGLSGELQAGRINTDQYAAATEAALLQSKQVSPASLQASKSINQLNADYGQGKLSAQQYASGLQGVQKELDSSRSFTEKYGAALKGLAMAGVLALGAAFVDAVHTAGQFESAMTRITALTDTSKAEIGGMTREVLKMSKEVGKSPQELAEGLYFIASSGYAGAQGLTVLDAAAKASAAGLGETKTVADAVTSALNAYKAPVEDAAHYTDLLIQVVKEGKGEPEAFAGSLGRILPIASAAGVSFEQVGASMATMTRVGLNAEESATALRGVLGALVAPGKQATEALLGLGISTDQLRTMIRDKGLLATLQELMVRTGGNVETLDLIIPNVRALTGVLATAGSQSEEYVKILGAMNNAAGATEKAFGTMSDTFEFKLKKSEASFDALKITVGNKVLPVLGQFFDTLGRGVDTLDLLITANQRIDDAFTFTRDKILATADGYEEYQSAVLATAVAAGKLTQVQADAIKSNQDISTGMGKWTSAADFAAERTGLLTESQFKLGQAQQNNAGVMDESDRAARRAADGLNANTAAADDNTAEIDKTKAAQAEFKDELDALKFVMAGAVGKELTDYNNKQSELAEKAAKVKEELDKLTASNGTLVSSHGKAALSVNERAAAEAKLAAVQEDLTLKQRKKNETDAEFDSRMASLAVKADTLREKLGLASGATLNYIDNSKKIGELQGKYDDINSEVAANAQAHDDATKRILFDIAAQQMAADGLSAVEIAALRDISVEWGLQDQQTADAVANVLLATNQLATDQNIETFRASMSGALTNAEIDMSGAAEVVTNLRQTMDGEFGGMANAPNPLKNAMTEAATHVATKSGEVIASSRTMMNGVDEQIVRAPEVYAPIKNEMVTTSGQASTTGTEVVASSQTMIDSVLGVLTVGAPLAYDPLRTSATQLATHVATKSTEIVTSNQTMLTTIRNAIATYAPGAFAPVQAEFSGVAASVAEIVNGIIKKIEEMLRAMTQIPLNIPTPPPAPSAPPRTGRRQLGGEVAALAPTLIGEAGPELFFPASRGFVMDNADSMRLIRAMETLAGILGQQTRQRSNSTFNMTVNTGAQPANIVRDFAMMQALAG